MWDLFFRFLFFHPALFYSLQVGLGQGNKPTGGGRLPPAGTAMAASGAGTTAKRRRQ
jgi:hypothetical protein